MFRKHLTKFGYKIFQQKLNKKVISWKWSLFVQKLKYIMKLASFWCQFLIQSLFYVDIVNNQAINIIDNLNQLLHY